MLTLLLAAMIAQTLVTRSYNASLLSCYDGDTCSFDIHLGLSVVLHDQTIRFCNINSPEIKPLITRVAATASRDALVSWIKSAKSLELRIPQLNNCAYGQCDGKDKYGRWLAFVYADGVNLNEKMVSQGLAVSYMECQ